MEESATKKMGAVTTTLPTCHMTPADRRRSRLVCGPAQPSLRL